MSAAKKHLLIQAQLKEILNVVCAYVELAQDIDLKSEGDFNDFRECILKVLLKEKNDEKWADAQ